MSDPRRCLLRGELREERREIERCQGDAGLEPRDDLGDPFGHRRLQQVVDRAFVERRDRVVVVSGDEHDVAAARELAGDVEAGEHRHPDVEEGDVGALFGGERERLLAVARFADDFELGPRLREAAP